MKIPSRTQLIVLTAGLSFLFDLLIPPAWLASLAYLIPVALASQVNATRFRVLTFVAVACLTLGDWLWSTSPPPVDWASAGNTALVLVTLLFATLFWPAIKDTRKSDAQRSAILNHDEVIGLGGLPVDITSLREASRLIESQQASLRRCNEDLDRFAHMAAHDLQEPLRMVVSFARLLKQNLPGLDADNLQYLQLVLENAEFGQLLVQSLLEYAELNADWQPEAVDLNELAYDAHKTASAFEPSLQVSANNLPTVRGNAKQLSLLFMHLIGNGAKFNRNEQPQVTVTAKETDTDWHLSFTDNGIGIEANYRQRAFEIFTKLQQRSEFVGTGVGLAICRRVMELHGGSIAVERSSHAGTTITCALPKTHEAAGGLDYAARAAAR